MKRRAQSRSRRNTAKALYERLEKSVCAECGKEGKHYVPPSLGEPGFFICKVAPQA